MPMTLHTLLAPIVLAMIVGLVIYYELKRPKRAPKRLESKYECLDVMTGEWRSGMDIKKDLEELKNGSLRYLEVSTALQHLLVEKLVLKEVVPNRVVTDEFPHNGIPLKVHDYKLTQLGTERRIARAAEGA